MPTISEQFTAVLNALVPFSIAVFVIAGFTFWGGEWLYRSVLNKRKELYALSRLDVDHWKELAERTTKDLDEKIKQLEEQQGLTAETRRQLGAARFEVLRLSDQLTHLGKANSPDFWPHSLERGFLERIHIPSPSV